ncbi:acyl-CoA N-acyltransferase [Aspergillus cavernicola]|uniref:Acyl-CoA N-acyltransferase n=1 Tax=Aspergillus cavernicola TaxID=176166 RepID=A0ABR4IYQ3_9EURO
MALSISPVTTEDVDLLVRKVEYPTHQSSPLHRLMKEILYKACGEDQVPVGLIGWTWQGGKMVENRNSWCPPSLDVIAWRGASKRLREERQKVLQRVTFMAVDPDHQGQGVGSLLMEMFCHYVSSHGLDAFVLSSPAGVRLYSKFGFRTVGVVETKQGSFTSMLRAADYGPRE